MKLQDYLEQNKISQAEWGRKYKPPVTQGAVSHWISGKACMSLEYAIQTHQFTNGLVTPNECLGMFKDAQSVST